MKLKQKIGDFRVRELLREDYLVPRGEFRVYRLTKRKLTTPEAVDILAAETGVEARDVGVAGWKDRQGITVQYMSVPGGRKVRLQAPELLIDTEGFAVEPYSSAFSRGNSFEINVRDLDPADVARLRTNLPAVREHGIVDYFDDQRFGNLTHGQGWIAKDLALGRHEAALRALLASPSERDNDHHRRFKGALDQAWGDWKACRDVAGRFGAHHSVFEHLGRAPDDFAGAFRHVAARLRLIHLYAWQSHLWNRAVVELVRQRTKPEERLPIEGLEGVLVMPAGAFPEGLGADVPCPLPGERLEGVQDPAHLTAFEEVLAQEGMVPDQLRIEGVEGFFMKSEPRALQVLPTHLRVRPAQPDPLNRGASMLRVRFELPRGSYASLVVKRLLALPAGQAARRDRRPAAGEGPWNDARRRQGGRPGHARQRGGHRDPRDDRGQREAGDDRSSGGPRGREGQRADRGGRESWSHAAGDRRDAGRGDRRDAERGARHGGYRKDDRGGQRGGRDGDPRGERGRNRSRPGHDRRHGEGGSGHSYGAEARGRGDDRGGSGWGRGRSDGDRGYGRRDDRRYQRRADLREDKGDGRRDERRDDGRRGDERPGERRGSRGHHGRQGGWGEDRGQRRQGGHPQGGGPDRRGGGGGRRWGGAGRDRDGGGSGRGPGHGGGHGGGGDRPQAGGGARPHGAGRSGGGRGPWNPGGRPGQQGGEQRGPRRGQQGGRRRGNERGPAGSQHGRRDRADGGEPREKQEDEREQ